MPRFLTRSASALVVVLGLILAFPAVARAGEGGGNGGTSGSGIWASTWWDGSPLGPGPYIPGPAGGAGVCIWTDVGPTPYDLTNALASVGFPPDFWPSNNSGGGPGFFQVIRWAARVGGMRKPGDHFDVVSCPQVSQLPRPGYGYTGLPQATPPSGVPTNIWLFWDTVPDPPSGGLPPIVGRAYDSMPVPRPSVYTSPSMVDGISHAAIVNFPTWFWLDSSAWHTVVARASGGGLTATVWATPVSATWSAAWDYSTPSQDPQGGVNLSPTALALQCNGPGTPYSSRIAPTASSPDCGTTFTESTFGNWVPLQVTEKWDVTWALSGSSGVVGGEGYLAPLMMTTTVPLRVVQIESLVNAS